MNDVNKKTFKGLVFFIVAMAVLIFFPAWTFNYWQAWIFLVVFSISVIMITLYLKENDPELLERRVNAGARAEVEKSQKIIQSIASLAFISIFVVSSLDHRFGLSKVSSYISILGDILIVLGLYFVFLVFKENSFTSAIIEVGKKQKVIFTGPYSFIRHPMYAGAFIMLLGIPLALSSYFGILAVIPLMAVIILRLFEEEKFLKKNLPGYTEYLKKVKYHLIPFIW
jgi:protein-S-isoprenylcysteine O-methyltransferase Ste14